MAFREMDKDWLMGLVDERWVRKEALEAVEFEKAAIQSVLTAKYDALYP